MNNLRQCVNLNKKLLFYRFNYKTVTGGHRNLSGGKSLVQSSKITRPAADVLPQKLLYNNRQHLIFYQDNRTFSSETNLETKPNELNSILESLNSDVSTYKRVNYEQLAAAVEIASGSIGSLNENDGVFLLNCCSRLPDRNVTERAALADRIWSLIEQSNGGADSTVPSKEQFLALISSYRQNKRYIQDFKGFLTKYRYNLNDPRVYEDILYLACENGQVTDGIIEILSEFKAKELPVSERLFNALILGHSRGNDIQNCEVVLDTMNAANLQPSADTFMELCRAYVENGSNDKAVKVLTEKGPAFNEMQLLNILRSATIQTISNEMILKLIMNLFPGEFLQNKQIAPDLRNLCIELVHLDRPSTAYAILDCLPVPRYIETENTDTFGAFLINEMLRKNCRFGDVVDVCKKLIESERNSRALHVCCEISLKQESADSLEYLRELSKVEKLRPHYFWPLIIQQYALGGETAVLNILQEMTAMLNVDIDYTTMSLYILPRLTITLKDTKLGLKMLEERGLTMSQILTPFISYLLHQQKLDDAMKILQVYQSKVNVDQLIRPLVYQTARHKSLAKFIKILEQRAMNPAYDIGGQVLVELVSNNVRKIDHQMLIHYLEDFVAADVHLAPTSCDYLYSFVAKCNDADIRTKADLLLGKLVDRKMNGVKVDTIVSNKFSGSAASIAHPRDMSLDELECHLVQLESKKMNTRGILRRILQLSVRAGKLERALEVKKQCDSLQVDLSPGMIASILDLMVRTKSIGQAEQTLKQLQSIYPRFSIDDHKIIDFAALLVENGRFAEARKILQDRARQSSIRGGGHVSKNIWQLLQNVAIASANLDANQSTAEWLEFLHSLGYCEPNNNQLLGPLVREHLLKNQIVKAVDVFVQISLTHRRTPLQYELMNELITLSNGKQSDSVNMKELLNTVVNTVAKVHGSINSNVSLVLAFAQSGTDNQLRKILMDPNIQINGDMLIKQCEYLSTTGAEATILKLAKCSRGMTKQSFKEQQLYQLLLTNYVRENNHEAALALYERLNTDDDGYRVTSEFTRNLVDLLEKNNLEIPPNVQMQLKK